jgi:outer membrane protein OmpA-like peptidoglycan-associated protein
MLNQHPDLRLTIEGHTDNVGNPAANQVLSEQRARAVRETLVATYGIAAGRLDAAGLGDTKPAAPNSTPEGRQSNRRVELVKR